MHKVIDQFDLAGKRVFIRVDYNVGIKDGRVVDDTRIALSLPTIKHALKSKARIILATHLGRPKGVVACKYSLFAVAEHLSNLLETDVVFPEDCIGSGVKKLVCELKDGEIILLENLRFHAGEEENDPVFAGKLADLANIYINDAFGTAHRSHASTVGMVSHFREKGIGFLMQKEIDSLSKLFNAKKPFLAVLGGVKVSDKIGVIENLMNYVDIFLIGGAMAYTFLKARGINVGKSIVEEGKIHQAEKILKRAEVKGVEICLPHDSILARNPDDGSCHKTSKTGEDWGGWMGLDIGPETLRLFGEKISRAETIFWNGPVGLFEVPPFDNGTREIASMIAESHALTMAGGGDSLTAIKQSGLSGSFAHLSTGGGASMEFLEGKTLPGLKALEI